MKARIIASGLIAAIAIVAAACEHSPAGDPRGTVPGHDSGLPPELVSRESPPDPAILLPPVEGYTFDDTAEPGELESSLDHGSVPYVEVRRRLVLDDEGFSRGEVTVVTLRPGSNGAERYLDHRYGEARRTPLRIGGVDMLRVETEPHGALAWIGPTFAVTFERGQEVNAGWLEDLARATVAAVADGRG